MLTVAKIYGLADDANEIIWIDNCEIKERTENLLDKLRKSCKDWVEFFDEFKSSIKKLSCRREKFDDDKNVTNDEIYVELFIKFETNYSNLIKLSLAHSSIY